MNRFAISVSLCCAGARRLRHHRSGRRSADRAAADGGAAGRSGPRRPDRRGGGCLCRRCGEGSVRLLARIEPHQLGKCDQHHRRDRRGGRQDQRDRHREERQICARGRQICRRRGAELRYQAQARHPAHRHRPAGADHARRGDRAQHHRDQAPVGLRQGQGHAQRQADQRQRHRSGDGRTRTTRPPNMPRCGPAGTTMSASR